MHYLPEAQEFICAAHERFVLCCLVYLLQNSEPEQGLNSAFNALLTQTHLTFCLEFSVLRRPVETLI